MTEQEGGEARTGGGGRRRRAAATAVKLVLGLGIVAFILSRISFDDVVELRGPSGDATEVRGRGLRVEGRLTFHTASGPVRRVPLEEGPILEVRAGRKRVRLEDRPPVRVSQAEFEGRLQMRVDGAQREWPLSRVRLERVERDEGWVELIPAYREGLVTIFRRVDLAYYVPAMALIFSMYLLGCWRWTLLLRAQGLHVGLARTFRLTFIGFFFNNVVPGLTGGDLVKGVMIARDHPGRGAAAVSTVIADRVIGIIVLALLSACVLLFTFTRYEEAAMGIFLFLGSISLAVVLFFSRRVRRFLKLDALLRRLPGSRILKRLDEAFLLYRSRKRAVGWAVLLSLVAHVCNILSIYLMGTDLGVDRSAGLEGPPLVAYAATVPIILIVSSVPLLPGGWGLGELMYGYFFRTVGVRNIGLSVGLSVLNRASILLWSLLGGAFLVTHRREAREALHQAEEDIENEPLAGSAAR